MANKFSWIETDLQKSLDRNDRTGAMSQAIGILEAIVKNPNCWTEPERREIVEIIDRVIYKRGAENA